MHTSIVSKEAFAKTVADSWAARRRGLSSGFLCHVEPFGCDFERLHYL